MTHHVMFLFRFPFPFPLFFKPVFPHTTQKKKKGQDQGQIVTVTKALDKTRLMYVYSLFSALISLSVGLYARKTGDGRRETIGNPLLPPKNNS